MPFDQVAIRNGGRVLRFAHRGKVSADAVEYELFDLSGRHTRDATGFGLSLLQDRVRHIISVTHTELVGVRRAHAVAPVVEDATGENGRRALEPDLPRDGIGGKLGLHRLEQLTFEDRLMLSVMDSASIDYLADVEPVLEQMGERSHAETDAAPHAAIGKTIGLGSDAAPVEVLNQGPH